MPTTRHSIRRLAKNLLVDPCSASDFDLSEGEEISDETVLQSENWSLYCLDFEKDVAVFVELPDATDLGQVPFVYASQYELAQSVIKMPIDRMVALSQGLHLPENLAFIQSTGRCGSTLASQILAEVPDVWSVSEPDAFTNLAFARYDLSKTDLENLAGAVTRFSCRPPKGISPKSIVIKPRSEATTIIGAILKACPTVKTVFLYRDAAGYVNSLYKFVQRVGDGEAIRSGATQWQDFWGIVSINAPMNLAETYYGDGLNDITPAELIALGWFLRMSAYKTAAAEGIAMVPIHYDDLNSDRRAHCAELLSGCGISESYVDLAMEGFLKDSHSGSASANSVPAEPIDDNAREQIAALLDRWDSSDFKADRFAAIS